METPIIVKQKRAARKTAKGWFPRSRNYEEAWERFWRVSARLPALWKSKKNSVQILREERTR